MPNCSRRVGVLDRHVQHRRRTARLVGGQGHQARGQRLRPAHRRPGRVSTWPAGDGGLGEVDLVAGVQEAGQPPDADPGSPAGTTANRGWPGAAGQADQEVRRRIGVGDEQLRAGQLPVADQAAGAAASSAPGGAGLAERRDDDRGPGRDARQEQSRAAGAAAADRSSSALTTLEGSTGPGTGPRPSSSISDRRVHGGGAGPAQLAGHEQAEPPGGGQLGSQARRHGCAADSLSSVSVANGCLLLHELPHRVRRALLGFGQGQVHRLMSLL